MNIIKHQLNNKEFYFPNWKVKYLLIGTFNPSGGEGVGYYYGRKKNQTWKLISEIFNESFDPNNESFFDLLRKHEIACVDMIDQVHVSDDRYAKIIGEGYKDSEIINCSVIREYNTDRIKELIKANSGINLYTTWGKGSNLKEWREEVLKLENLNPLVSPSLAARVPKGENKFDYMLNNWKSIIR